LKKQSDESLQGLTGGAIDFHAHILVPEVYSHTEPHSLFATLATAPGQSPEMKAQGERRASDVVRRMVDIDDRLAAMDRQGVALQVLSCSLVHQCTYWADAKTSLRLERTANDHMAAIIRANPHRFVGLGGVPLHEPLLAAGELERCVATLGLSGVQISTRARDMEIGDKRLRPFWAKAEELGAVVYVHPAGNADERLRPFQMWNSLGQSIEETFAIASLFYEGILETYPRLKVCISHGGGYMPYNLGRVQRNYLEKPSTRTNMKKPPVDYLRMLHYDSCVYDADTLRRLVDIVGADRVVLGSDYPVGDPDPLTFIRETFGSTTDSASKILRGNAVGLLGHAWDARVRANKRISLGL
jgi:aminocarboxymuconate-semialdehyde decarboxylase